MAESLLEESNRIYIRSIRVAVYKLFNVIYDPGLQGPPLPLQPPLWLDVGGV